MKHSDITTNTRIALLKAACKIVIDHGAEALTLEAVANEASMSKGGLLYHFPSKKKLIEGMVKFLIDDMESSLEREMEKNGGKFLLAFVQVSINKNLEQNKISAALFAAIGNDPELLKPLEERYIEWQNRTIESAPSPEIGTLVRLAMDGLWISDLLNLAPPSAEMRNNLAVIIDSLVNSKGILK
jgi:AcrR family transcriptional regulator